MAATTDPTQRRTDDIARQAAPAVMPPGLRHSDDTRPGYTRRREEGGFAYFDVSGKRIDDASEIARIDALAIPPAYQDVWICPDAHGHLQATGRDARGRKQYRYHRRWRETRDANKYERMAAFGRALPKIRRRVACDLKLPGMSCDKVIAAIVQLLDTTLPRRQCRIRARKGGARHASGMHKHTRPIARRPPKAAPRRADRNGRIT